MDHKKADKRDTKRANEREIDFPKMHRLNVCQSTCVQFFNFSRASREVVSLHPHMIWKNVTAKTRGPYEMVQKNNDMLELNYCPSENDIRFFAWKNIFHFYLIVERLFLSFIITFTHFVQKYRAKHTSTKKEKQQNWDLRLFYK